MRILFVITVLILCGIESAGAEEGEKVFRECAACHQLDGHGTTTVGPHLAGIFGRKAGSASGFGYSAAMRERGEAGLIWDHESLNAFLTNPKNFVPGTAMSFECIAESETRKILLSWLEDNSAQADSDHNIVASAAEDDPEITRILSLDADPDYGEYLAGECLTCHQTSGATEGIPPIAGLAPGHFVGALLDFKAGKRINQVMQLMAGNLGDEELASLALFFSKLEP